MELNIYKIAAFEKVEIIGAYFMHCQKGAHHPHFYARNGHCVVSLLGKMSTNYVTQEYVGKIFLNQWKLLFEGSYSTCISLDGK